MIDSPEIKYILISYQTKQIVCDYIHKRPEKTIQNIDISTQKEETETIKSVARKSLDTTVKSGDTDSFIYDDKYLIFYTNDSVVTVLCITDKDYPGLTGFELVSKIRKEFRKEFSEEEIKNAYAFILNNKFDLEEYCEFYDKNQDSAENMKLNKLKDNLLETKDILIESVESLAERDNLLSHSVEKAEELKELGVNLLNNTKNMRKKNMTCSSIFKVCSLILFLYLVLWGLCGSAQLSNCLS